MTRSTTRFALTVGCMLTALAMLAGCNEPASNALVVMNGVLASVSCPAVSSGSNAIADNIINISTQNQQVAQNDAQLAASSAAILAQLCPAAQNLSNLIVQASVNPSLSGTAQKVIGTTQARPRDAAPASEPKCGVVSTSPFVYRCTVTHA